MSILFSPLAQVSANEGEFKRQLESVESDHWRTAKNLEELIRSSHHIGNTSLEDRLLGLQGTLAGCRASVQEMKDTLPYLNPVKRIGELFYHIITLDKELYFTEERSERHRLCLQAKEYKKAFHLFKKFDTDCEKLVTAKNYEGLENLWNETKKQIFQQKQALQSIKDRPVVEGVARVHIILLERFSSACELVTDKEMPESFLNFMTKFWEENLNVLEMELEEDLPKASSISKPLQDELAEKAQNIELQEELIFQEGGGWRSWFPSWFPFVTAKKSSEELQLELLAKKLQLIEKEFQDFLKTCFIQTEKTEKNLQTFANNFSQELDLNNLEPIYTLAAAHEMDKFNNYLKILTFIKNESKNLRIASWKGVHSFASRSHIYYAFHLESYATNIQEKINFYLENHKNLTVSLSQLEAVLFSYLDCVTITDTCVGPKLYPLHIEVSKLGETIAHFDAHLSRKVSLAVANKRATYVSILQVVGEQTLQKARKKTREIFRAIQFQHSLKPFVDWPVQLAVTLKTETIESSHGARSSPGFYLALHNLKESPIYSEISAAEQTSPLIDAAVAAVKVKILRKNLVVAVSEGLKRLSLNEYGPFNLVRYAECAFKLAECDSTDPLVIWAKKYLHEARCKPTVPYPLLGYFTAQAWPKNIGLDNISEGLLFTTFVNFLWGKDPASSAKIAQLFQEIPLDQLKAASIWPLVAYSVFKKSCAEVGLLPIEREILQALLTDYLTNPKIEKDFRSLVGTAPCLEQINLLCQNDPSFAIFFRKKDPSNWIFFKAMLLYHTIKNVKGRDIVTNREREAARAEVSQAENKLAKFLKNHVDYPYFEALKACCQESNLLKGHFLET